MAWLGSSPPTAGSAPFPLCPVAAFNNTQRASGLGDLTVRIKGTVKNSERSVIAVGIDVRVPTGNADNFLGTGAIGIKPFVVVAPVEVVATRESRISVEWKFDFGGRRHNWEDVKFTERISIFLWV